MRPDRGQRQRLTGAGAMVTASHSPIDYHGMKLVGLDTLKPALSSTSRF